MTLPPSFKKEHLEIVLKNCGYKEYSKDEDYLHYINGMNNILTIPQKETYCDKLLYSILKQTNIPELEFMDFVKKYLKPSVKLSIVALVDVLGFSKMMENISNNTEEMNHFLINYKKAVDPAYHELCKFSEFKRKSRINKMSYARIFSDNILYLNELTGSDGEIDLVHFIDQIALYQLRLVLGGFVSRGAIVVGDMYCTDTLVVGYPLVKASNLEKEKGGHPKIIIDKTTIKAMSFYLKRFKKNAYIPMLSFITKEVDGPYFINYLYYLILEEEIDSSYICSGPIEIHLLKHKNLICENLRKFKGKDEAIYEKYEWLADYHNFFCSTHIPRSEKMLVPDATKKFKFIYGNDYYKQSEYSLP
ncbi:hypothetical protein Mpsy_2272 [Methanolobus psychrophilus R15]|nr:hypothetical protein Mpsy_2272 [Methanolobus psychrophilus R15]